MTVLWCVTLVALSSLYMTEGKQYFPSILEVGALMLDKDQAKRNQLRHEKSVRTQENIQKLRQGTQHIEFNLTLRVAIYARQSNFIQMERNVFSWKCGLAGHTTLSSGTSALSS
jgi:hypothetical protein